MALSDDEDATLKQLRAELTRCKPDLELLDAYYEGMQRLETLGLAVPPDLHRFVTIVNWPRICADAIEERLDLEGFRLATADRADDEMERIWQANGLDEEAQLAHLDALVLGRSYATVGSNEDDAQTPLITVESPMEMVCRRDPRTREVTAAARITGGVPSLATVGPSGTVGPVSATLYLPDVTVRGLGQDRDDGRARRVARRQRPRRPRPGARPHLHP